LEQRPVEMLAPAVSKSIIAAVIFFKKVVTIKKTERSPRSLCWTLVTTLIVSLAYKEKK
jgi:hypothetical protein